jgi:hypothetical protein
MILPCGPEAKSSGLTEALHEADYQAGGLTCPTQEGTPPSGISLLILVFVRGPIGNPFTPRRDSVLFANLRAWQ